MLNWLLPFWRKVLCDHFAGDRLGACQLKPMDPFSLAEHRLSKMILGWNTFLEAVDGDETDRAIVDAEKFCVGGNFETPTSATSMRFKRLKPLTGLPDKPPRFISDAVQTLNAVVSTERQVIDR